MLLLPVKNTKIIDGFQCVWMVIAQLAFAAFQSFLEQGLSIVVLLLLCVEYSTSIHEG